MTKLMEELTKELQLDEHGVHIGNQIDIIKHNQKQITYVRNALKKQTSQTPKDERKATEYVLYHLEEVQQAIKENDIYRLYINLFEGMKYQSWAHIMPTVPLTIRGEKSHKSFSEAAAENRIELDKRDALIREEAERIQQHAIRKLSKKNLAERIATSQGFWEKIDAKPLGAEQVRKIISK